MESSEERQRHFLKAGSRHAGYYLQYATEHPRDWKDLEVEHANLLVAARHYREACDYLLALREALQPYLDLQGHWNDSLELNEWTIDLAQRQPDWVNVARFTHDRADMLNQIGNYTGAEQLYQSSEESYHRLGQEESALKSRHMRSMVVRAQGRLKEAEALCKETIERARELGMNRWLPHPFYVRALLARDRGDFASAEKWVEEDLRLLDVHDEPAMVAQCHRFLGELELLQGRRAEARSHLETSLRLSEQVGVLRQVPATQRLLGDLARVERKFEEAEQLYRDSLLLASQLGNRPQEARILVSYGQMEASRGSLLEAFDRFQRARTIYRMIGDPRGVVSTSLLKARVALRLGRGRTTARLVWDAIGAAVVSPMIRPRTLIGLIRRKMI